MFSTVSSAVDNVVSQVSITQATLAVLMTGLMIRWATQKKWNLPPCPPTLPLFGNALDLKGSSLAKKTTEWREKYGPVFRFYTGLKPWFVISNIETLTEAYHERGSDFANRPRGTSFDHASGDGKDIAMANYTEALKYRRKIAMLALRQYMTGSQHTDRIHSVVIEGVANMEAHAGPFDPHQHLCHMMFNILHAICFGYTLKMDDPKVQELMRTIDSISAGIGGFWEDFFPVLKHFPTKEYRKFTADFDTFSAYVKKHMKERQAIFDENHVDNLVDSVLLAQKQSDEGDNEEIKAGFTDDHLAYLLLDVFFAGIETSRSTLEWVYLTLAANQKVQKKIHDEIDTVLGDNMPGRDRRLGLVYTEATIMEVMRMYPVVPMGLPHETMRDTQVGGFDVPAGSQVIVNQHAILRDPNHWEKPEVFMPERFIEDDGTKLKPRPKSWIPFSSGPRNCIGEFLARMNILYSVAGVLQKLHFSLAPGTQADFTPQDKFIMLACKPYKVVVTSRKH